jgi:hypothetical protein
VKIRTWHEGMTDYEARDLAYWERNMLALRYADGWYHDDVPTDVGLETMMTAPPERIVAVETRPRYPGWRRVLSLEGGKLTFHIPDWMDVGNLPEIEPNWDGHTTEEKWARILQVRGCRL